MIITYTYGAIHQPNDYPFYGVIENWSFEAVRSSGFITSSLPASEDIHIAVGNPASEDVAISSGNPAGEDSWITEKSPN